MQRELGWAGLGVDLPPGLELQWLGTAGFRLSAEGTTLLIDPYVSRVPLRNLLTNRPMHSDPALVADLPTADAILLGHTHFDHAADTVAIAARDACPVFGSTSASTLLEAAGLGHLGTTVEPHQPYEVGPFRFRFVPSRHARLIAGRAVPFDGEITCDSFGHLGPRHYRCGDVWGIAIEVAGTLLYHQGSADLIESEVRDDEVDVLLCGIAGRSATPRFTQRVLDTLRPALVVAHHHDDMFRPLDRPMGFSFNVNLEGFAEEVGRLAPGVAVRTLEPLQTVGAPAESTG